ncbi:hypothetical protein Pint_29518 [Pistacia integerrima]|uniref:Uncharacterized protein n=1 Tax=Pistacia integerrima TaxID=434235 RepID=A0ACC0X198_9ROSI|nr:hypothetical protein Pint_29518 [Pistacia integerrima]
MQPKSSPCVFLGYPQVQSAYKCLDLKTQKIYIFRHVLFDEPNTPTVSSTNPTTHTPKCSSILRCPSHSSALVDAVCFATLIHDFGRCSRHPRSLLRSSAQLFFFFSSDFI